VVEVQRNGQRMSVIKPGADELMQQILQINQRVGCLAGVPN
jgi:hypothetical protein